MYFLNQALRRGRASVVYPFYFACSTLLVICSGLVFFEEYKQMSAPQGLLFVTGLAGAMWGMRRTATASADDESEYERERLSRAHSNTAAAANSAGAGAGNAGAGSNKGGHSQDYGSLGSVGNAASNNSAGEKQKQQGAAAPAAATLAADGNASAGAAAAAGASDTPSKSKRPVRGLKDKEQLRRSRFIREVD
mgnify:CR=1 FL=1|jgi:hypothetical protein